MATFALSKKDELFNIIYWVCSAAAAPTEPRSALKRLHIFKDENKIQFTACCGHRVHRAWVKNNTKFSKVTDGLFKINKLTDTKLSFSYAADQICYPDVDRMIIDDKEFNTAFDVILMPSMPFFVTELYATITRAINPKTVLNYAYFNQLVSIYTENNKEGFEVTILANTKIPNRPIKIVGENICGVLAPINLSYDKFIADADGKEEPEETVTDLDFLDEPAAETAEELTADDIDFLN